MFDPQSVQVFRMTSWELDAGSGMVSLRYAFDEQVHFTETIRLPPAAHLAPEQRAALDRCLTLLHLVAGVSYYKAAVPPVVSIETPAVPTAGIDLLHHLLAEGLGEFSFTNNIPLPRPEILATASEMRAPTTGAHTPRRPLVAVGGGKDSCVSIELLRTWEPLLASINEPRAIKETIAASGLASVHAKRTLSPELMRINGEGALNGHVPVTAIVSLTLVAMAIIEGRNDIVMSNERSASAGNFMYDGVEINHQYSKSHAVEQMLASLVSNYVSSGLRYFSLLRPLSELDIARRFAATERYDRSFTSCNRAFRIDESRRIDYWCCNCDKCRFVFLALAPFMSIERLTGIFGTNMLDEPAQVPGFDALIGWNANKPFECVGEVEESVAALLLLAEQPGWSEALVVRRFLDDVLQRLDLPAGVIDKPFVRADEHSVPEEYLAVFDAHQ